MNSLPEVPSEKSKKRKKARKEKGTRKNIRKILDDDKLDARTLEARAAEEARLKRIQDRQARYCSTNSSDRLMNICYRFLQSNRPILSTQKPQGISITIARPKPSSDVICLSSDDDEPSSAKTSQKPAEDVCYSILVLYI